MTKLKRSKKIKCCAYCGENNPETVDHVPPKNLFPEPRASNLITVPCCKKCHAGTSKDDEYFRASILSSKGISDKSIAQDTIESLIRSLNRSKGFAKLIMNNIKQIEITTEAGIYLGKEDAFKLDISRIDKVAQRIIRGLFFYEKKIPLPKNYQVTAKIQQFGLEPILKKLENIKFPELRIIQDGIFCYTFLNTDEDPNSGIWLLLFYKSLPVVGFIKHPNQ